MDENTSTPPVGHFAQTVDIVSAYVANNSVPLSGLPNLIASVHAAIAGLRQPSTTEAGGPERATPAQIKKSISHDTLISFEDGKPYKTLRRHLTLRGLSPEVYRAKWGLPADYPMTSAGYSAQRSKLARDLGLGQQRRKMYVRAAEPEVPAQAAPEKPKRTGSARKVTETAEG